MTWEEAVEQYRRDPAHAEAVRWNYFDEDALEAAQRFAGGEEFRETLRLLGGAPRALLDLGAGTGMASYAFARQGWQVTALEPDPSEAFGAGAIRALAARGGVKIAVEQTAGEQLPWAEGSFEVVYARQVLHHAADLAQMGREVARVLRPGGIFLAVREHVIRRPEDLAPFLEAHPLHRFYGGEKALLLPEYLAPMEAAGLQVEQVLGPLASPLNLYPVTESQLENDAFWAWAEGLPCRWLLRRLAILARPGLRLLAGGWLKRRYAARYYEPGNIYSFLFRKPVRPTGEGKS